MVVMFIREVYTLVSTSSTPLFDRKLPDEGLALANAVGDGADGAAVRLYDALRDVEAVAGGVDIYLFLIFYLTIFLVKAYTSFNQRLSLTFVSRINFNFLASFSASFSFGFVSR